MKRIIAALLCIATLITNAQEASENLTIGIFPVTATDPAAKKYSAQIHSAISNVFAGKKRFTVVDRTKLDQLTAERDLQKQEDFLEGFVVEQGKSLGAQYLIQGNINQASAQSVQIAKVKVVSLNPYTTQKYYVPGYNVTFVVSIQTIDVATGKVKGTKTINLSKQWETSSEAQAMANSIALLDMANRYTPLKEWANEMFPVSMKIVKLEELDKKGRPKTVLIKGGEDMDLHRGRMSGSILQVYFTETISLDGSQLTRNVPIGEIMVDEAQGDFTICKVKDGAEEILKRQNEGKTLLLKLTKW